MLIVEPTLEEIEALSTPYNSQASMQPVPFGASLFTGAWGGLATGQMFVAFSWAAHTLRRPDNSTIAMPAPPAALSLAVGDLSQVAGGTRGALTLSVRRGLVKDGHICAISGEQQIAMNANNVLRVASPSSVAGYDGWSALVGSASNQEFIQDGTGGPAFPIPFGTSYAEPVGHFSTAGTQYAAAMLGAVVYIDLNASTTYYFYPTFDVTLGFVRFFPTGVAVGDTAPSEADANQAWSDGRISLGGSNMQVSVGAGGTSGSPSGGSSRLV